MAHRSEDPIQPRRHTRVRPAHRAATAIAFAGIGVLLYWLLAARPLWVDEEMLLLNVRDRGWAELAGALWLDQSAPLGWLWLEKLALVTLGPGERAVRLLPTLFGIGTLAGAVWIGRRWLSAFAAAVLAALCATGEWLIFFTKELKHYSADACGALWIAALAAWAVDGDDPEARRRRLLCWWAVAAVALWLANGALFVTPGAALVLASLSWRRDGWQGAARVAAGGGLWLLSFAGYYLLVLRHALGNAYLQNYWGFAFPPAHADVAALAQWTVAQAHSFALKPGSTGLPGVFWLATLGGIVLARPRARPLALICLTLPPTALLLAWLRLVPPFERLAIWAVPAAYVAVALCADAADWLVRRPGTTRQRWLPLAFACALAASVVALDVFGRGRATLIGQGAESFYRLDDRRSIDWIMRTRRPGDVILTTHYGLAALWWYGGVNVAALDGEGHLADGTPVFEVGHAPPGPACADQEARLTAALRGAARTLVYAGYRNNLVPEGFEPLLFEELGRRGQLVDYRAFATLSLLASFDLSRPTAGAVTIPIERGTMPPPPAEGCLTIAPGKRW